MNTSTALTDATVYVYRDGRHVPERTNVLIRDGKIAGLTPAAPPPGYEQVSLAGLCLIPAGYDTHCHGGGPLVSPTEGVYDQASDTFKYDVARVPEYIDIALREHAKHGTAGMNLSAMAIPMTKLEPLLQAAGARYGNAPENGAVLRGIDFESIYFRDEDNRGYTGAQNPDYFVKPDVDQFRRLQDMAHGAIRRVGIGFEWDQRYPEERPAKALCAHLRDEEIPVGMGHSGAREAIVTDIIAAGGKFVYIHLGNGLNKINLRQDQSRLFESVAETADMARRRNIDLYAELILDGVHLDRRFILWANYMFGKERIIGITDNICVTGTPPTKRFSIAGTSAIISEDNPNAIWVDGHIGEILCGSKATFDQILRVYVSVMMDSGPDGAGLLPYFLRDRHEPKSLAEALDWALHATATNPARLYGLLETTGSIEEGKEANLAAVDASNAPDLRVQRTWVRGTPVK